MGGGAIRLFMSGLIVLGVGCGTAPHGGPSSSEPAAHQEPASPGKASPESGTVFTIDRSPWTDEEQRDTGERIEDADLSVLFIGNSHTTYHFMPRMFVSLIEAAGEKKEVFALVCRDQFLVDHAANPNTRGCLRAGPWTVVVLQAQKYSTSGFFSYPFDAAIEFSNEAKDQGSRVVMFPEWAQRGNKTEAKRVHRLHQQIAGKTGATVAPVGFAWERALAKRPKMNLYAPDGNHSSRKGAFLTACVLYTTITGGDPRDLVIDIDEIEIAEADRRFLAEAAWETCRKHGLADDD